MVSKLYNIASEFTTTVGMGTMTLNGAVSSYINFGQAGAKQGDRISYSIEEGDAREIGWGIYNVSGGRPTLTRNVWRSTNANNPINLDGKAQVSIVAAAEDLNEIAGIAISTPGRNLIDNPFFDIWQRGTGPFTHTSTAPPVYSFDRWYFENRGNAVVNAVRLNHHVAADWEAMAFEYRNRHSAEIDFTGSSIANSYVQFGQTIEDATVVSGSNIIISFFARCQNGVMSLRVYAGQWSWVYVAGVGTEVTNAPTISQQTVTISERWHRHFVLMKMPSLTEWQLLADSTSGTDIVFIPTDTRNGGVGNQTNRLFLMGVQVELAHGNQTEPSPLEHSAYATDLERCQRFYHVGNVYLGGYHGLASGRGGGTKVYPTPMRAPPTITIIPGSLYLSNITPGIVIEPQITDTNFYGTVIAPGDFGFAFAYSASSDL